MTVTEAARKIGVSISKPYKLVPARQIGHYPVCTKIDFSEHDMTSFLDGCRVSGTHVVIISQSPRLKLKHSS